MLYNDDDTSDVKMVNIIDWSRMLMEVLFPNGMEEPLPTKWDHQAYSSYLGYVDPRNMLEITTPIYPIDSNNKLGTSIMEITLIDNSRIVLPIIVKILRSYRFHTRSEAYKAETEFWSSEASIPTVPGVDDATLMCRYHIIH